MKDNELNKSNLIYFLNELYIELRKISTLWKTGRVSQDTWDKYQNIVIQIDKLIEAHGIINKSNLDSEIIEYRNNHKLLIEFVKGKITKEKVKKDYFDKLCQSIESFVNKLKEGS